MAPDLILAPGRDYSGGAAGIYVHRNESEVVSNGEFIADATLTAQFGSKGTSEYVGITPPEDSNFPVPIRLSKRPAETKKGLSRRFPETDTVMEFSNLGEPLRKRARGARMGGMFEGRP